jgi:hypothetical protein
MAPEMRNPCQSRGTRSSGKPELIRSIRGPSSHLFCTCETESSSTKRSGSRCRNACCEVPVGWDKLFPRSRLSLPGRIFHHTSKGLFPKQGLRSRQTVAVGNTVGQSFHFGDGHIGQILARHVGHQVVSINLESLFPAHWLHPVGAKSHT